MRGGQKVLPHRFEEPRYFEGCLPIEVMAERGDDVLAFGPMKPVGLCDERLRGGAAARREPLGLQLQPGGLPDAPDLPRAEADLRHGAGLEKCGVLRFGSIHRNSYLETWRLCDGELALRARPEVRLAGQLTGVEGYIESTAMGLLCALFLHGRLTGRPMAAPPETTALGALHGHITRPRQKDEPFSPTNINFGLLPPLPQRAKKRDRRALHAERAQAALGPWLAGVAA